MERLGVSPDAAFHSETIAPTEEMKDFLEYFQSCNPRGQEILLKTLHFLAEQLRPTQDEPDWIHFISHDLLQRSIVNDLPIKENTFSKKSRN